MNSKAWLLVKLKSKRKAKNLRTCKPAGVKLKLSRFGEFVIGVIVPAPFVAERIRPKSELIVGSGVDSWLLALAMSNKFLVCTPLEVMYEKFPACAAGVRMVRVRV